MKRNVWVTGDTHFNHNMLVDSGLRPHDYQQKILSNWKKYIQPDDMVIHLGDIIFKRGSELEPILHNLPGRKILVRGNHDKNRSNWYINKGFDFVCSYFMWKHCLFSHKPMDVPDDVDWNIHGHLHDNEHRLWEPEIFDVLTEQHLLIALEQTNYEPVLFDDLILWNRKYRTLNQITKHGNLFMKEPIQS